MTYEKTFNPKQNLSGDDANSKSYLVKHQINTGFINLHTRPYPALTFKTVRFGLGPARSMCD